MARVIPGSGGNDDKILKMQETMIMFGDDSHCGDVRQPSLLESGGLSGRHMLSELKDYKDQDILVIFVCALEHFFPLT